MVRLSDLFDRKPYRDAVLCVDSERWLRHRRQREVALKGVGSPSFRVA